MNSKIFISSFLAALIYIPSSLGALQATSTVNGSIRDSQIKLSTGDDIALPTVDTFRNEQNYFNDQPKASTALVEDFKSSAVNELINMSNSISTRDNSSTIVPCAAENASSIKIMVPSDFENSHKDSFGTSYYCKAKTTELADDVWDELVHRWVRGT